MGDARLLEVLGESQQLGFLGAGDVQQHIDHARTHAAVAKLGAGERWCDLGSGGGVPGLVVAVDCPEIQLVLIDRSERRAEFLQHAIRTLELSEHVQVALGDAADLAQRPEHWQTYDGVLARAFGPPAATAECAAGLLRQGGRLVVSEPPNADLARWPPDPLAQLGMQLQDNSENNLDSARFAVIIQQQPAPDAYPRPWKQIRKRPLF